MVNYRRADVPGATYFFTVTLRDRRSRLLIDQIAALREALQTTKRSRPFRIDAMAVLPDHVHASWTLPPDDHDYSGRWRAIKAGFTRAVRARGVSVHRKRRGEYDVWQGRFWEHLIRDGTDFTRHVDYIHFNPVQHGLAQRPVDWPWSSLHRYIRQGIVTPDWAVGVEEGQFGE
jgi:putative transposase